ncbi:MAG: NAD(P)-binding protein [Acidimicrobiales bacterium]
MSDTATRDDARTDVTAEHLDVVIVGAGISGIGSAHHLTTQRPGTSFVVLDALESFGGTWLTHTYPGIRSDSTCTPSATGSSPGPARRSPPPSRSSPTWAR